MSTARKTVTDLLLLQLPAPPMHEPVSRVGGWPLMPRTCPWPVCPGCDVPMQFILQIRSRDLGGAFTEANGLLLVWRCNGDLRGCDASRPHSGRNFASFVTIDDLVLRKPPGASRRLEPPYALFDCKALVPSPLVRPLRGSFESEEEWRLADPYQTIRELDRAGVAGLVTRQFDWVGEPEQVACRECRLDMMPVVQLEGEAAGGSAFECNYVLFCEHCGETAWLTQVEELVWFDDQELDADRMN